MERTATLDTDRGKELNWLCGRSRATDTINIISEVNDLITFQIKVNRIVVAKDPIALPE